MTEREVIKIQKFEEYLTGTGLAYVTFYILMLIRFPMDFLKPSVIFIIVPLVFSVTILTEIVKDSLNNRLGKDIRLYIALGISMLIFFLFHERTGVSTFLGAIAYFYGRRLHQNWFTCIIQLVPFIMFVGAMFIAHINQ